MKYSIYVLAAAIALATVVVVSAQTKPPAPGPPVDQATVDAAMERLRTKQAAGRTLEERVSDLERKLAAFESQNKRIAELETRLAAATKQIDQLIHSPAAAGALQKPNGQTPKEKPESTGVRTWQCWVSAKLPHGVGNSHSYRDDVQARSSAEAYEMFHNKHPNEDVAQVEENRP